MTLSKNAKLCNYGKMFKNPHICPHRTTVLLTNIPEHWMLDAISKQPYEQGAPRFLVEHTHTACLVHQDCFQLF